MLIELQPSKADEFSAQMPALAPWMHQMHFGGRRYTGHYKYDGIEHTWTNDASPDDAAAVLRSAYEKFQAREEWTAFLRSLLVAGDIQNQSLLDIGSATGRNSLLAVDFGFRSVTAAEIRPNQVAQLRLILDAAAAPHYRDRIRAVHEPLSADDPAFGERYAGAADVVMSLGIFYHLANPWQHILNLKRIAKRRAIIYTLTHYNPIAKQMWFMTPEDRDWITKATSGISWTPHFREVARLCERAGFRRVTIRYPQRFVENFRTFDAPPSRSQDVAALAAIAWQRLSGHRIGAMRNHEPSHYLDHGINPNYFAYVCEV